MKHIKTFEQYNEIYRQEQLDESFLGKKLGLVEKLKTIIMYYKENNSMKNLNYWLPLIEKNDIENMKDSIETQYNRLRPSIVITPGGNTNLGSKGPDLISSIKNDYHIFDDDILEIVEDLNLDKDIISDKLDLEE